LSFVGKTGNVVSPTVRPSALRKGREVARRPVGWGGMG